MQREKSIMDVETILPADFTGVFYFTNATDEDFIGKWGGKEYVFPAVSTSPMVMPYSPLEIQQIRKKFAKDLGEREFYKSKKYKDFKKQEKNSDGSPRLSGIHQAATYSDNDLAPFIQKCLEPLPISRTLVREAQKNDVESHLSRNTKGRLNTRAVEDESDLERMAKGE